MKHIIHMDDVHVSSYANLVLLQRLYSQMESKRWTISRNAFLKEELKKKGKLACFYCNKDDLKLKTKKRSEKATVDHVVPKSNGGDPFSSTNFVVCCDSCNRRKASMSVEEFLNSNYIKKKMS